MNRQAALAIILLALASGRAQAADYFAYAGSYTAATARGIYAWRFSPDSGTATPLGLVAETPNPSHVWASPNGRFLYAVNWQGDARGPGDSVSAFAIDRRSGALTPLNRVAAQGVQPNQVMIDPSGRIAATVTYNSGTFSAFAIARDGSLGDAFYTDTHSGTPRDPRQTIARAHGIQFSRDGKYAFVAELGLDRIYSYRVDARTRAIAPGDPAYVDVKAGSAPRRLQRSPDGRFLYVNGQNDSTVTVFSVQGGRLAQIQQLSTLPPDFTGSNTTAEIQISRDGRFLYVSNRGHDSICLYAVDRRSGFLTRVENTPSLGKSPRNIMLDPTGRYLFAANQNSDNIAVFRVDARNGHLTHAGPDLPLSQPGSIFFVRAKP